MDLHFSSVSKQNIRADAPAPRVVSRSASASSQVLSQPRLNEYQGQVDQHFGEIRQSLVAEVKAKLEGGQYFSRESALDHVFGVTCGNDISARDWQKGRPGGQWLLGKTFDSFAPIGPTITTMDEIKDIQDLNISKDLKSPSRHKTFQLLKRLRDFCRYAWLQPITRKKPNT